MTKVATIGLGALVLYFTPHKRIVPSTEAEASMLPSGENATAMVIMV